MPKRRPLTDAPDGLEPAARDRIRTWARSHLPWGDQRLGTRWSECRDWHLANGVQRADWEAAFRNWLRQELRIQERERQGDRWSPPNRSRPVRQPGAPQRLSSALAEVLPMFRPPEGE